MNKFRKKYQNVVERKNHLAVISKDHNTIDSLESQALDGFYVESSKPEYFMQRMGQLFIKTSGKKRYNTKFYKTQTKMIFPAKPRKNSCRTQTLDNFIIKPKEKPKNAVQKPVHFNIIQNTKKKNLKEEQLDSFICYKKEKPALRLQNVHNVIIEKKKKLDYILQSLNHLKLPATGKFFNNHPILKSISNYELEYLKIKAPFKCINSSKLLIPLQPKKIKFTDITSQNSSNFNYIINKVKVFHPSVTSIKNTSSLIIPQQPKKTSFIEITPNKASNILYDIPPKKKLFNEIAIESIPDIFIPEQPKKRYYSAMNAETMTIHASERPEFCLEIDPNEEIFIPNVYDMLLIQNYWDDLSIKSFRVCLRPKGYIGKSSQNLDMFNKNGNEDRRDNNVEEIKESDESQSQEDNEKDKDVLKDFSENYKEDKDEKNKVDNIYEDRVSNRSNNSKSDKSNKSNISNKSNNSNNSNKADINKEKKHKEKAIKGHRFRDLKKKIMMLQDD